MKRRRDKPITPWYEATARYTTVSRAVALGHAMVCVPRTHHGMAYRCTTARYTMVWHTDVRRRDTPWNGTPMYDGATHHGMAYRYTTAQYTMVWRGGRRKERRRPER
jgi:hypothetical protein